MYWHSRSKRRHPAVIVRPTHDRPMGYMIPEMEEDGHYHQELLHKLSEETESDAKRIHGHGKREVTIECGRFQGKKKIHIKRDV